MGEVGKQEASKNIIKNWVKAHGYITPGGDACWKCPICGEGLHVYGVETLQNHINVCPNCGAKLLYPWEKEDGEDV